MSPVLSLFKRLVGDVYKALVELLTVPFGLIALQALEQARVVFENQVFESAPLPVGDHVFLGHLGHYGEEHP